MNPGAIADEAGEQLDPIRLRRALGGFPTGVTVVTASIGGRVVGMTANSFSSVSLDPPLVSWCAANSASSHAAFVEADAYAVHVLGADHQDVALRFAGKSPDKFAGIGHRPGRLGAPLIDGLAPVFECRVWARYPGGDHTILVGEVVHLLERVQEPLLFHSGLMRRIEQVRHLPSLAEGAGAKTNVLADDLARASHAVSGELRAILVEFGLSLPEWRVLVRLADTESLAIAGLAAAAMTTRAHATGILERLVGGGLVERCTDHRRVLARITDAGRARIDPVLAALRAHEEALLRPFNDAERATLKHVLNALIPSRRADAS